jgi:G3E family GTPase
MRRRSVKPRLYLLNGPLGAGKTTLLRHLLAQPEFAASRVIENEFAAVSIDTETLHDHRGEVATIAGVCICCSTGDELTDALHGLAGSDEPVLIEATGVANSLRIIEKLIVDDLLDRYELAHSVFVLDAAGGWRHVVKTHRDELLAADTVVLTKTDLVDEDATAAVTGALQALGVSTVTIAKEGAIDVALLARPSGILRYFATFNGDLPDEPTSSYSVVDVDEHRIALADLRRGWDELSDRYGLQRMKGDIRDDAGVLWHVDATPEQLRLSDSRAARAQLVLIGEDARAITGQALLLAMGEA